MGILRCLHTLRFQKSPNLTNETMPQLESHQQLIADAKRRTEEYNANLANQERTDDAFTFAQIGSYVPSEAEEKQLRRLADIQKDANEATFDSRVQF